MNIVDTWAGKLCVNMNDAWIRNHTIRGDIYEEHIILGPLKKFIERSRFLVDVGANNGNHTIAYAKLSKDANIFSFEPQVDMFKHLKTSVESNDYRNINLYNVCLGHTEMTTTLGKAEDDNLGGIGLGIGGETCEMKTLDSFNLPGLDFMKIDVEGAESLVIQGAKKTIEKYKPVIYFEHHQNLKIIPDGVVSPFLDLTRLGYNVYVHLDWDNYLAFHKTHKDLSIDPCLVAKYC